MESSASGAPCMPVCLVWYIGSSRKTEELRQWGICRKPTHARCHVLNFMRTHSAELTLWDAYQRTHRYRRANIRLFGKSVAYDIQSWVAHWKLLITEVRDMNLWTAEKTGTRNSWATVSLSRTLLRVVKFIFVRTKTMRCWRRYLGHSSTCLQFVIRIILRSG
jgi:hypothetical protein